jgi:hypothetical protein
VTLQQPRSRRSGGRKSTRATVVRVVLVLCVLALAFLLGVAFARTLDERPEPGGAVTDVRTLTPLPQQTPGRTVTVTETVTTSP